MLFAIPPRGHHFTVNVLNVTAEQSVACVRMCVNAMEDKEEEEEGVEEEGEQETCLSLL